VAPGPDRSGHVPGLARDRDARDTGPDGGSGSDTQLLQHLVETVHELA
jgi:hypothetical protein